MKSPEASNAATYRDKVVVSFTLPSNGEKWNWPVQGKDTINALCEILDRANIPWSVKPRVRELHG